MIISRLLLASIFTLALQAASAADLPTQLRIEHSIRISHQFITISFADSNGAVSAAVKTRERYIDGIEKTYTLTQSQALKLRQLFSRLDLRDLRESRHDPEQPGTDGENWVLSYLNGEGENESIEMWSPSIEMEGRRLTDYVALFRFALDAVGFDPDTTLPRSP